MGLTKHCRDRLIYVLISLITGVFLSCSGDKTQSTVTETDQSLSSVCIQEHCFSDHDINEIWEAQPQHIKEAFQGELRRKQWLSSWIDRELLALEQVNNISER